MILFRFINGQGANYLCKTRKYRHRDLGFVAASTTICSYLWGPAWLSWGWLQHLGVQCWCPVQGCWLLVRWVVGSAKSEVFSVKMDGEKFATHDR